MTDGESGEAPQSDAPPFEAGRRSGGRGFSRLPVDVALEELEAADQPAPEPPRRRWSDTQPDNQPDGQPDDQPDDQPDEPPAPVASPAEPAAVAMFVDEAAVIPVTAPEPPPGGPKFLGRVPAPVEAPARRRVRPSWNADAPPPGTRVSAWSRSGPVAPPKTARPGRAERIAARSLVIACVVLGVVLGYPRVREMIRERSVPAALRSYVAGKGVRYAPPGQGFTVRLPKPPLPRDQALPSATGAPGMFMHRSIASGPGYWIVIRVVDVPPTMALPFGAVGALADPRIGGAAPVNVRKATFAGVAAFAYDSRSSASPTINSVAFLHGHRLYVISVQAKSAGTVLHALATSFHLTR